MPAHVTAWPSAQSWFVPLRGGKSNAAGGSHWKGVCSARGRRFLIVQSAICAAPCRFNELSPSRMAWSFSGE